MENLTFGEQVKIILSRKKMTIKQLAEEIEERTGMKMSRQNLTQRLGRDNFQEQDMRMIASILGCPFTLSILAGDDIIQEAPSKKDSIQRKEYKKGIQELTIDEPAEETDAIEDTAEETDAIEDTAEEQTATTVSKNEQDMTIGEIYEIHEGLDEIEEAVATEPKAVIPKIDLSALKKDSGEESQKDRRPKSPSDPDFEPVIKHDDVEEDLEKGDINPYSGREYQTNSVRMHPSRIGYVQVYDRSEHKWTDMTEWAFLGYQERKKVLLGKEYEPPIYLD